MLSYQFAIWKSTTRIEDLGNVPLSNDRDAFAFAKRVIRERLMHKDAERVAASVISNHSAMSALGTKRTFQLYGRESAFGGKADIPIQRRHVRL